MKLSMKRVFMWLGIGVMSLHEHYILCEYDCVCVRACGCVLKLMNITKITFCLFVCKIKRRAFHLSPSINTPIYLFDKMTRIGMQSATVIKTLHWNMKIHKSFIRGNLCGLFKRYIFRRVEDEGWGRSVDSSYLIWFRPISPRPHLSSLHRTSRIQRGCNFSQNKVLFSLLNYPHSSLPKSPAPPFSLPFLWLSNFSPIFSEQVSISGWQDDTIRQESMSSSRLLYTFSLRISQLSAARHTSSDRYLYFTNP